MRVTTLIVLGLVALAPALSACGPGTFIGAAAAGGVAIAEERSIGTQVDDATINLEISEGLFRYNERLFQHVAVDVTEGRVLLTGSVEDPEDRIQAARIAWSADGVQEVINEIQVTDRGGIGDYLDDAWISNQLRAEMLFDKDIDSINYNVDTVNGVIYLTGIARDRAELDKVIAHARTIAGVREVRTYVRVEGDAPPPEQPAA